MINRTHRRSTVEPILAAGAELAAMPLLDQRSPEAIIDDLVWARPYVDEARAAVACGEVMTLEEYKARIAAQLAATKPQWHVSSSHRWHKLIRVNIAPCPKKPIASSALTVFLMPAIRQARTAAIGVSKAMAGSIVRAPCAGSRRATMSGTESFSRTRRPPSQQVTDHARAACRSVIACGGRIEMPGVRQPPRLARLRNSRLTPYECNSSSPG